MTTLADPGAAWRAVLIADAAVLEAIDSGAGEQAARYRIFPAILPQNEKRQSITYAEISAQGDHHMEGPSGLAMNRVQFNAWADNPDDAYDLGLKVKAALDGYSGTIAGVVVQGIFFDSARDLYDDDAKLFYRAMDFIIWFAER